jgi:hypothetical protein
MHDAPPPGPVDLTFTSTPVATVVPGQIIVGFGKPALGLGPQPEI